MNIIFIATRRRRNLLPEEKRKPETSRRRLDTGAITYASSSSICSSFHEAIAIRTMRIMMIARDDDDVARADRGETTTRWSEMGIGGLGGGGAPYSRCQERRTTFRHRFNCLLSNGSPRTLNSRTRWLGRITSRCDSSKSIDRDTTSEGSSYFVCEFRTPCRATGGKITARHAKATTTRLGLSHSRHTDLPRSDTYCTVYVLPVLLHSNEEYSGPLFLPSPRRSAVFEYSIALNTFPKQFLLLWWARV